MGRLGRGRRDWPRSESGVCVEKVWRKSRGEAGGRKATSAVGRKRGSQVVMAIPVNLVLRVCPKAVVRTYVRAYIPSVAALAGILCSASPGPGLRGYVCSSLDSGLPSPAPPFQTGLLILDHTTTLTLPHIQRSLSFSHILLCLPSPSCAYS